MSDAAAAAATDTAPASIGQGNLSSLVCRRVLTHRLSIVDRLAGRSVTGRGLQISVHHHGLRLHLEWSDDSSGSLYSSRFMKRRFEVSGRAKIFYTELCSRGLEGLCSRGLEGLCTCVFDRCKIFPHERAPGCSYYHLVSIFSNRSDDDD